VICGNGWPLSRRRMIKKFKNSDAVCRKFRHFKTVSLMVSAKIALLHVPSRVVLTVDRLVRPVSCGFRGCHLGQFLLLNRSWSHWPQDGQGFAFGSLLLISARCRFSFSLTASRLSFAFFLFSSAFLRAFSRFLRTLSDKGRSSDTIN